MPRAAKWDGEWVKLADAVSEYKIYLADNKAPSTVENKMIALRKMVKTLGAAKWTHEVDFADMTQVWMVCGKTRSNNSRIIDHQAFKHFFTWCENMKYREHFGNPMKSINCPKPHYRERNRVPVEQFEDLKKATVTPRDRMYVSNLLYMLCRKVELYHIRWADVNREAGEIYFVRHKTGDDERLAISDELEQELEYYEDWYRWTMDIPKGKDLNPAWFLTPRFTRPQFIGSGKWVRGLIRPDVQMGKQDGARIVVAALDVIGFPTRDLVTDVSLQEGAHTLRRSGARALFDAEVEAGNAKAMRHVQLTLGHKTMQQTENYIGAQPDRMERNAKIRGQVMYPKARAIKDAETREIERGGLRLVVSK